MVGRARVSRGGFTAPRAEAGVAPLQRYSGRVAPVADESEWTGATPVVMGSGLGTP